MTHTARPYARIYTAPPTPTHAENEAPVVVDIAERAGRYLDTWQHLTLDKAMRTHRGRWVTPETAVLTPRQNGKSELGIARELAGLFAFGENILHFSSHRDLARNAFDRLLQLIQSTPELDTQIGKVRRATTCMEIATRSGNKIRYSGRSMTADLLVFDDAHAIDADTLYAAVPTLATSNNPQIWYLGGAVRKRRHRKNVIGDPNAAKRLFTRLRARGLTGTDPNLCWIEYSAPDTRDKAGQLLVDIADPAVWRQANPSTHLNLDHLRRLYDLLAPETFATDCLGIGDWPDLEPAA